jgi:hypothetical protein
MKQVTKHQKIVECIKAQLKDAKRDLLGEGSLFASDLLDTIDILENNRSFWSPAAWYLAQNENVEEDEEDND